MALLALVVTLAMTGCASSGMSPRTAGGMETRTGNKAGSEQSWLESGVESLANAGDSLRSALHRVYQSWAGTPYKYGGQSKNGVDCSSFVRQTIDSVEAYELPRTTVEQARVGLAIPQADLRTGDLVFFKTGGLSHHVGIYLSRGRFMHASSSQGVTISRMDNVYWRHHYWQSRRILAGTNTAGDASNL